MNPLEEQIKRISEKLQQLLKQHQLLQKENDKLHKELGDIKKLYGEKARQIDELDQKVAVLKTATNNMSDADKKELEKRLNGYIKEIDRCIEMLGE
jgi:chromosome segregation ATPase